MINCSYQVKILQHIKRDLNPILEHNATFRESVENKPIVAQGQPSNLKLLLMSNENYMVDLHQGERACKSASYTLGKLTSSTTHCTQDAYTCDSTNTEYSLQELKSHLSVEKNELLKLQAMNH